MFKLKNKDNFVKNVDGEIAVFKTQTKARNFVENREWKGKVTLVLPDGTEQTLQE